MAAAPREVGLGYPAPIFPVRDLDAAAGFYARLGFRIRRHDDGYGYAERERLRKPWGVRQFDLLDLDNNQLRFGRVIRRSAP
jgi:catechol 2,3-dioxygenase-like lactoylglutathione lyase family enzyme